MLCQHLNINKIIKSNGGGLAAIIRLFMMFNPRMIQTILKTKAEIESLQSKVFEINSTIQKSAGLEQEKLNQEIANLRAELAGFNVKLENSEKKLNEIKRQKQEN